MLSRPNPSRKQIGADGERIARRHLEYLGWRILAQNFRTPQGEIDLIAEQTNAGGITLVFVEVKTRRGMAHGIPRESVTLRKRERLLTVAQLWLAQRGTEEAESEPEPACRFDVAEVFLEPSGLSRVVLCQGAFGQE